MSTEHQQYSPDNQMAVIGAYAAQHDLDLVRTYTDDAKSGLQLKNRHGLQQLLHDVKQSDVDFEAILVYDVSRWGRFQDPDESASYEFTCRNAGIDVHYCAEQFVNDGTPISTIVKGVKRAMAAEYSRELSAKVFAGQCRLIEHGFRQGGMAGYGLRRMRIDQSGTPQGVLARGEYKSLQTDRVILVPGPAEEVEAVRWMYRLFVDEGKVEREIATALNERGIRTDLDRLWTRGTVHQVLTNEKYIGNNVYNRRSFKLKEKRERNPPEQWVRANEAFEPIVEPQAFFTAQGIIRERNRRFTDEEMLDRLRRLFERQGYLSGLIIDEAEHMPSSSAYAGRFGSLLRAYRRVGFNSRAELELDLPRGGLRWSPRRPRRLGRVRQLHEQGFGVCFVRRGLRLAKLAPPQVECAQRQSVRRAEIAAGLARPVEPLNQLLPLRGGAPRPTSRTAFPPHDSARLRVVGSGE